jgi:methyl-accepting chemotaxis protein
MKELVGEGDLSGPAEAQYTRSVLDVPYGVVLLTLYNNAGDPIGKITMARDFSSSRAAAGRSLVWQGLLALSAIVVLAGMILIVVRGLLLRPLEMLTQQFVKLAQGRRDQPIKETEILCDEMQALARAHEQLRTKPQPFAADTDKKISP